MTESQLAGLRMSQLLEKMHASGISQPAIDACFDAASPKAAAIELLQQSASAEVTEPSQTRLARCTHAFDSTVHAGWKSEHLAMRVGDEVVLEESPDDKNWWKGHVRIRGARHSGYFPKAFVQRMEPELELQVRCPQCRYERTGPRV